MERSKAIQLLNFGIFCDGGHTKFPDRVSCRIQAPCLIKARHAPCHVAVTSNSEKKMPAFIRYSFFGFVALALSACGSSGSSRLLESDSSTGEESESVVQELYPGVDYLITDIPAAVAKFASDTSMDTSDEEDMEGMDEDGGDQTTTDTGARALSSTPAELNALRNLIIGQSSRYLSTGAVLARTNNSSVVTERPSATTCEDSTTGPAKCIFEMDYLRGETIFHLGSPSLTDDENVVSFRSFMADRQPVMVYRETLMSQVRTAFSDEVRVIYQDENGSEYLLTSNNVTNMNLDDVELPMGVTTAPDFADLLAVYGDGDGNEYLLTLDNVTNMDLDDVELPMGVTTAPDFASLSKAREEQEDGREDYVGYDGMLRYSMFFVGVHRFFDDEGELQHARFEHASFGRIYDENAIESGIQSPSVALTGEGVMVGMEREISSLESHLVQGDVNIEYSPFVAADTSVDPVINEMNAMIDISITNIERLNDPDDGEAWYADALYSGALTWVDVVVTDSKFSGGDLNPITPTPGKLEGSFYGTEDDPEVGGVFHHQGGVHEIIGSFGSKLDPVPDDDPGMTNP